MDAAGKLFFLTGASGFVGARVCAELLARGARVRAVLRRTGDSRDRPGLQVIACGDLASGAIDPQWFSGTDAVIHLAAHAHQSPGSPGADDESFRRTNVVATEALARAAAAARVARFVYASSIKVNGEDSGAGAFSAADAPQPRDAYGRSKLEAENILRDIAAESSMEAAIVRPPLVYGPGVKANFLRLLAAVDRGVPLPLSTFKNRRSLIHVGNLADAIIASACHPAAAGKTYLVSDGEDISTADLVRRIARAGEGLWTGRLTGNLIVDGGPIRRDLLWRPPFTLDEGLAETAAWYRSVAQRKIGQGT
ncbi:MAG: NAD-dependent epimerase/dehydratase family protein [Betaproteobacteria bacterium]|nr:NAD-dependent epimerase/dehydratase family protein [Betaproteobacteria bacterium]